MGTRCTVRIEDISYAEVYVHWDGYPEHMLPWLTGFNKRFAKMRGHDPQYKFAQLLRSSAKNARKYELDKSEFTGYGVLAYGNCSDAEYVYTLHNDGTVTYKTT